YVCVCNCIIHTILRSKVSGRMSTVDMKIISPALVIWYDTMRQNILERHIKIIFIIPHSVGQTVLGLDTCIKERGLSVLNGTIIYRILLNSIGSIGSINPDRRSD